LIEISSFPVAPRSMRKIEAITASFLQLFMPKHLEKVKRLDVEHLLDVCLWSSHRFRIDLVDVLDRGVEGQVVMENQTIQFTESGWENVVRAVPRSLFTGCHEAYHVLDHAHQVLEALVNGQVRFLAARGLTTTVTYRDPEWQANHGAGALLMPLATLAPLVADLETRDARTLDINWEVQAAYGVSAQAAETRLAKLQKMKDL